jgi:hypothetical protein
MKAVVVVVKLLEPTTLDALAGREHVFSMVMQHHNSGDSRWRPGCGSTASEVAAGSPQRRDSYGSSGALVEIVMVKP